MWRVKFNKQTHVAGKNYSPGDEDDFDTPTKDEIERVRAGEVLGPSTEYGVTDNDDVPASAPAETKKRTRKADKVNHPAA